MITSRSTYYNYTYRSDGVKMREQSTHQYTKLVMKISASGDTTYVQRNASDTHFRAHYGNYVKETGQPDKIYNEEGYIALHGDSVSYHFFERDYLGSVRAVFDLYGNLEQTNDYNVTGIPSSRHLGNADVHKHTGKEFQGFNGLAWYDNNARYYDPILGRFTSQDPLAEKYPWLSPYNHCANNPINAIDPSGEVVIFINGLHFGDGGKAEYWNGLDNKIMNQIGDKKVLYYDGSMGGIKNIFSLNSNLSVENRFEAGELAGLSNAKRIISNLKENESIKFVSHSMGAAYTKGFISGLYKYSSENNIDISGLIEMEIDLAPFQPGSQKAHKDVNTIVIQHAYDGVAGIGKMPNATQRYVTREDTYITDKNSSYVYLNEHSVDSFTQDEIKKYIPSSNQNAK